MTSTIVVMVTCFSIVTFNSRTTPKDLRSEGSARLAGCGVAPNCVSSFAADDTHAIEPLNVPAGMKNPIARLAALLQTLPGAKIEVLTEDYLHVVFHSRFFRFRDDAEFLLEAGTGRIHLRSASRVGWGDFGVNRRRLESVRQKWAAGVVSGTP